MSDDRFIGDGSGLVFGGAPAAEPKPRTDVSDGDVVQVRTLTVRSSERVLAPAGPSTVTGTLAIEFIELTGTWRYSVDGLTVDPASIRIAG